MTLAQMIQDVYADYGNRFQVTPADILRFISYVQREAFVHDCKAFIEKATLTYSAQNPLGPYSWPTAARNVLRIEDANGAEVAASLQPIRRTATLHANPAVNLVFVYHILPAELSSATDDANVLVPPEWRRSLLVQGAILLCDSANYGDKATLPDLSNVLVPFWDAMDSAYTGDADAQSVGAW